MTSSWKYINFIGTFKATFDHLITTGAECSCAGRTL